jgi:hypothetical protein
MLLPKTGVGWKAAGPRFAPARAYWMSMRGSRLLVTVALALVFILLWRGINAASRSMSSYYCWGPAKSPLELSLDEAAQWHGHLQTPVLYNSHAPIEVESGTIVHHNLNKIESTTQAAAKEERVLILTPLKDASPYLAKYFELVAEITYPHHLVDLAFLVSDSTDDTTAALAAELDRMQKRPDVTPFRSATIITKDFGFHLSQDVNERHLVKAQGPRRIALGRARNYLLYTALKPEHSWVYWRDADIVECPPRVIEDLIAHDRDIIVPNIWFHRLDKNGVDIEGRCESWRWLYSNGHEDRSADTV